MRELSICVAGASIRRWWRRAEAEAAAEALCLGHGESLQDFDVHSPSATCRPRPQTPCMIESAYWNWIRRALLPPPPPTSDRPLISSAWVTCLLKFLIHNSLALLYKYLSSSTWFKLFGMDGCIKRDPFGIFYNTKTDTKWQTATSFLKIIHQKQSQKDPPQKNSILCFLYCLQC